MLTNNVDFKRAIAQQFDPDTDYSEFDEAEVDGAFEATVYQLLMERGINAQPLTPRTDEIAEAVRDSLKNEFNPYRPTSSTQSLEFGSIIHRVIKWNGKDIGLEYEPGQVRFPGRRNSRKLRSGYGHLRNHLGCDGEALDCYLAPAFFDDTTIPSDRLFKVSQISPEDGSFDEDKMLLGYQSLDDAKAAYLREMPLDYFGGIREIGINDLDQYAKPQDPKTGVAHFSEQLSDIKETLTQFFDLIPPSPNFSEDAITKAVESAFAPHVSRLDLLISKLEFGEPIQIEGEILEDSEYEAIASVDSDDVQTAVKDWGQELPDEFKNLIGEEDANS
ncbi:MAG: hypothetical protein HWQ38_24045 [Nostoc sp. NMS7]|uniref:hypothetical protein n=1 Tax=Nostoc sp. NMS7 TaxID=2815391 RepID=UPI0025DB2DFA|nr:hypothetical protein [Nostoc sp. NMS7]MBN3949365.1 hypothetical protein [Nostoc sp. NMS7]